MNIATALRHSFSDHDVDSPLTFVELSNLANEIEADLIESETQFSDSSWRYVDGLRALASKLRKEAKSGSAAK